MMPVRICIVYWVNGALGTVRPASFEAGWGVLNPPTPTGTIRYADLLSMTRADFYRDFAHRPEPHTGPHGWGAMKDLQGNPQTARIPVIVLTGHELKDHLKRAALAGGACAFLVKPCLPERLERELAACISARLDAGVRPE